MRSPFLAFVVLAATLAPSLAAPCADTLQRNSLATSLEASQTHPVSGGIPLRFLIGVTKREFHFPPSGHGGDATSGNTGSVNGGNVVNHAEDGSIANINSSAFLLLPRLYSTFY